MKLFLAAEAKHPESIKRLRSFIGDGFDSKSVVYVPTAANGEAWGQWKEGESLKIAKSLWKNLKIVQLEDIGRDQTLEEVIGKPDILWIAGGMPGYLLYWVRRTKLDKYLPKVLEGETIYVGSSAGSMICAETNYLAETFPNEEEPGAALLPGLGFIDFEIFPHFEERYMEVLEKSWDKGDLYLLKNGDVITVVDGKVTVLGEERIFNG
jgi:peptidase E